MMAKQKLKSYNKKMVIGDRSEHGFVKFARPLP